MSLARAARLAALLAAAAAVDVAAFWWHFLRYPRPTRQPRPIEL